MLEVAVYLYTAEYHLLNPCDAQYGPKVACHFSIIPTCVFGIMIKMSVQQSLYGSLAMYYVDITWLCQVTATVRTY